MQRKPGISRCGLGQTSRMLKPEDGIVIAGPRVCSSVGSDVDKNEADPECQQEQKQKQQVATEQTIAFTSRFFRHASPASVGTENLVSRYFSSTMKLSTRHLPLLGQPGACGSLPK